MQNFKNVEKNEDKKIWTTKMRKKILRTKKKETEMKKDKKIKKMIPYMDKKK